MNLMMRLGSKNCVLVDPHNVMTLNYPAHYIYTYTGKYLGFISGMSSSCYAIQANVKGILQEKKTSPAASRLEQRRTTKLLSNDLKMIY